MGGRVKNMKEQKKRSSKTKGLPKQKVFQNKRSSKTTDIVSYGSKVSVNGVTCVFVVHFRSSNTFNVCKLA